MIRQDQLDWMMDVVTDSQERLGQTGCRSLSKVYWILKQERDTQIAKELQEKENG